MQPCPHVRGTPAGPTTEAEPGLLGRLLRPVGRNIISHDATVATLPLPQDSFCVL